MLGSRVDQLTNFGPGPISAGWATPKARRYRLLLALFPPDLSPFEPWLERVSLPVGTRLVEPNTPIEHVYSLEQSIASVVATTPQGRRIEVGIIGREALSSIPVLLGADRTTRACMIQTPGEGLRIRADDLWRVVAADGSLHEHLLQSSAFWFEVPLSEIQAPLNGAGHEVDLAERGTLAVKAVQGEDDDRVLMDVRLAAMGQMASVLAHELNQPLAAASNYLSAAKRLPVVDGSRAMALVDKAGQQILRAGEIIQRLRDFVSKGQLTRHVAEIGPVLKESVALALMDRSHRDIKVVEHVDPGARFVRIDRVQIQQVLVNLIRNAAEAMEGSPRREITLATAPHEVGLIEVSIADTGSGMAEDIAGRLFQPFVTTKPDGMGVGLSICRTIVEAHGGHIRAEASPEGGTVFRFTLEGR